MPNTSSDVGLARVALSAIAQAPREQRGWRRLGQLVRAAVESLRPYQWLKNALVFVPLAAAHRLAELNLLGAAAKTFGAFSLCAAAVYLLNDLHDREEDLGHPHKRLRAIASGRLPARWAWALVPVLLVSSLGMAGSVNRAVVGTLAVYLLMTSLYTMCLKALVLLDAFTLAAGYALRVLAGSLAVHIAPSPRLLAFCIFLFFSLALLKRYAELSLLRLRDGEAAKARAYQRADAEFLLPLGVVCAGLSVLILAEYLSSGLPQRRYSHAQLIWVTCVLLLYWNSYLWLMAHRGRMTDDPLVFAMTDRTSCVLVALMGVCAWAA